jgi:hypothetical protein
VNDKKHVKMRKKDGSNEIYPGLVLGGVFGEVPTRPPKLLNSTRTLRLLITLIRAATAQIDS